MLVKPTKTKSPVRNGSVSMVLGKLHPRAFSTHQLQLPKYTFLMQVPYTIELVISLRISRFDLLDGLFFRRRG